MTIAALSFRMLQRPRLLHLKNLLYLSLAVLCVLCGNFYQIAVNLPKISILMIRNASIIFPA